MSDERGDTAPSPFRDYEKTLEAARNGDREALDKFPEAAAALLESGREMYPDVTMKLWDGTLMVRRPGTTAKLGDIDVLVLSAHIRPTGVDYSVSWISDGSRKTDTVEAFELSDGEEDLRVGFIAD